MQRYGLNDFLVMIVLQVMIVLATIVQGNTKTVAKPYRSESISKASACVDVRDEAFEF